MTGAPSPPKECPKDLSFVTPQLVTPYPQLEAFIGKEALDATLHKSIDESIVTGGGIERSIQKRLACPTSGSIHISPA